MNVILEFKKENGLTYRDIQEKCGFPTHSLVYNHCHGVRRISVESAKKYHQGLGIPLSKIRPDIWGENVIKEAERV